MVTTKETNCPDRLRDGSCVRNAYLSRIFLAIQFVCFIITKYTCRKNSFIAATPQQMTAGGGGSQ